MSDPLVYNNNNLITKNFWPATGKWFIKQTPITASVAMEMGSLVELPVGSVGGVAVAVTNASTTCYGILAETIATTDPDYAVSGKLKAVWIPESPFSHTCYFRVGAGALSATIVGCLVVAFDAKSLDVTTAVNPGIARIVTRPTPSATPGLPHGECRLSICA